MTRLVDITGNRYGRQVVLSRAPNASGYGQARWRVRCDCGNEREVFGHTLVHKGVKSCGCHKIDHPGNLLHGKYGTPEHTAWAHMRSRCLSVRDRAYPEYGGRGIRICGAWQDFEVFLRDMGPRPPGTSLDRIDNSLGYSPENCRWASQKMQVRNRRTTVQYEHQGQTKPLQEWAEHFGLAYRTVWHRYAKLGWRGDVLFSARYEGRRKPAQYT